ncbi:hypothetical protein CPB83DRAFT_899768 [Crepidotus variabilis]|uniref:Uncharacterized protein n=1 Tax=Crepidotus variabilis TaxID=179855 RepID=A0A9P6E4D9_9AGAR|nr:hypothetical protein CPB83DRAFT_899768 [Crepidotus variabilis]
MPQAKNTKFIHLEALPSLPAGAAPPAIYQSSGSHIDLGLPGRQSLNLEPPILTFDEDQVKTPVTPSDSTSPILNEHSPKVSNPLVAPASLPSHISPSDSRPDHQVTTTQILTLIVKSTAAWVLGGVCVMIAGIGIAQGIILPRIYACPPNASCPISSDINKTNALTLLQTLMQYWLQAGTLIASMGLLKLSAYQAWFVLMRDGNTMDSLDLSLGAIRGSFIDAGRLVFRRRDRWVGAYILGQLGVVTAISLIIGLSITRDQITRALVFTYSGNTEFPNSSINHLNTVGQLLAIAKVNSWALNNDTSHSSAYRGSLVVPDSRNITVNHVAGGPRISGTLSCVGVSNYSITMDGNLSRYNMFYRERTYIATPDMQLAQSMASVDTALSKHIWASNSTGRLPNATRSSDGVMDMALCTHAIHFTNNTQIPRGAQEIKPNQPITSGSSDPDPNVRVADSVSNAIVQWWGGWGTSLYKMSCRGSVVGPVPSSGISEEIGCPLTEDLWTETVTSMLDGIVQTGPRNLEASQKLVVPVETIDTRRWWLQALIPLLTLILYGVGLHYTISVSQGRNVLKKLTLTEVIGAAQTEHVRDLVGSGGLKRAVVQYENESGFVTVKQTAVSPR